MSADDRIAALYQLPLDEFTPARNALAKELKAADIKTLEKPSVPAWAVNQLYWKDRDTYERLVHASERLRGEHRKLLAGKKADLRSAEQAQREVLREAIDSIRELLQEGGQPLSPATLTAVQETLEALPAESPGRLTRPLKPRGFEALSGITIAPSLRIVDKPAAKSASAHSDDEPAGKGSRAREREQARAREREERERKERQREAARALKAAETAMLRAEEAVKTAEKALAERKAERDAAVSEYQRARLLARE